MSRLALFLLATAAVSSALISRVVPWVSWVAYIFLALLTAAFLERRARSGAAIGRLGIAIVVLLGGGAAAAYGVSETLIPFSIAAAFSAASSLLVTLRHEGGRFFAYLKTRPAFYSVTGVLLTGSVLCIVVVTNIVTARHAVVVDMTKAQVHSLAEPTLKILDQLSAPVAIHAFYRRSERIAQQRIVLLLRRYQVASKQIEVHLHDPDRTPSLVQKLGVRMAGPRLFAVRGERRAGIAPTGPLVSVGDAKVPGERVRFRAYTEEDVTNGIVRATRDRTRICFLIGHGERTLHGRDGADYGAMHQALSDHNFESATVSLARRGNVPPRCRVLLIAGPKAPLFARERTAVETFLERGGGLVLFIEPGVSAGYERFAEQAGARLGSGIVTDPKGERLGSGIVLVDRIATHPALSTLHSSKLRPVYLDGVRTVEGTRKEAAVLVRSSAQAWVSPTRGEAFVEGRDRRGPLPLGVASAIGRSRAVVVGDADLASNRYFTFPGNRALVVGLIRWAARDDSIVAVTGHQWRHSRMTWTQTRRRWVRIVTQAVLPGLAIFIAIYLWRTRRRL